MFFLVSDHQVALISKTKMNQMESVPMVVFSFLILVVKTHQDWLTEGVKSVGVAVISMNFGFC